MDANTKKKLVVPVVLAITVLATGGCTMTSPPGNDAGLNDGAVADADFDAGCIPPEQYDPISHSCVPIV